MVDLQSTERKMKAFGSARRLRILSYLKKHPNATVGKLAEVLGVSQAAASVHLRFLKNAGAIVSSRRGKYTSYRLPLKKDAVLKAVLRGL